MNASVVIPTMGRVSFTRACIASIRATAPEAEIIVVDSSPEPDACRLSTICAEIGAVFVAGPHSVSEKRNLGARRARSDFVLFLDSDCTIRPGCITAHMARLQDPDVHASQGSVHFTGGESLAFRAIRCSGLLDAFRPVDGAIVRSAAAGNLMVRRESFLEVEFDPRFGPPGFGGEDVDLGLRLAERGYPIVGTPAAVVHHDTSTWNGITANARRFVAWGRSEARLIETHPTASYLDMPSPAAVLPLVVVFGAIAALFIQAKPAAVAISASLLTYLISMTAAGAITRSEDRLGGALAHWVFILLDLGRVSQGILCGKPFIAARRIRFADDQVAREWRDIVPMSWALWLSVVMEVAVLWWAAVR